VWFTNPVGTNLVMFNLYLKKTQRREINQVRSRALGQFFFEFRGFYFSLCMLVEKKMRWTLGGKFELPTWFITELFILRVLMI
jgi:hypothetical protein